MRRSRVQEAIQVSAYRSEDFVSGLPAGALTGATHRRWFCAWTLGREPAHLHPWH